MGSYIVRIETRWRNNTSRNQKQRQKTYEGKNGDQTLDTTNLLIEIPFFMHNKSATLLTDYHRRVS
jgi:hypothetical protein